MRRARWCWLVMGSERVVLGAGESLVADLGSVVTAGPPGVVWGLQGQQLNMNLVSLGPGDAIDEHVNDDVDVLIAVNGGRGTLVIEGVASDVSADSIALVPRGARRSIVSSSGLLYYSIHVRRDGLVVGAPSPRA